ncbi:MAG TPA: hypothetical protein VJ964_07750 [Balneolaceae bacterium]|nr:hypothetical protein [Balneolaceae bacterium]
MIAHHTISRLSKHLILIFALIYFVPGCGSTGSDSKSGPSFNSGSLAPGETFSFTFMDQGTPYYCQNHQPNMTGEVVVSKDASISGQDTVTMKNTAFHPQKVTVQPGTKIVWINKETDPSIDDHTVTSGTPSNSGGGYGY